MTQTTRRILPVALGFVVLVAVASAVVIDFDVAAVRGIAIGAALGVVNLVAGLAVTRRSLQYGVKALTATLALGFGARLIVLVSLFLLFQQTTAVDAAAFGLTFIVFFFVYLAVEMVMIEQLRGREVA